jgi:hypothetical protein
MEYYSEICNNYDGKVPYHIQLETKEWCDKRNKIIIRDKNTCQNCHGRCIDDYNPKFVYNINKLFSEPSIYEEVELIKTIKIPFTTDFIEYKAIDMELVPILNPLFPHVHHKYYIIDNLAWDYPNDALILFCHKCHLSYHKDNIVPVYKSMDLNDKIEMKPCFRCNGAGHFPEYKHVENGVCFQCKGARYEELK